MRHTFTLGRLFDIRVGVHVSWIAVYLFTVFSIAGNISGVSRGTALGLASVCALLLFVSVIAHELAHALAARRYGVRTRAITLFLFGGVATLECEPPSPRAEVVIALAGPVMSALLALVGFGALTSIERLTSTPLGAAVGLVVAYVALANGVLAAFNLVPAFPMDGGRVLRAVIWRARKSRAAATGAASIVGLALAGSLVAAGGAAAIALHAWSGVWYVLIGAFLVRQSWLQLADSRVTERLERGRVRDVMEAAPPAGALDAVSA